MKPAESAEVISPQSRCRFALVWDDITPPANIYHRMWGASAHDRATGVHRPLRATVAAFESALSHSPESTRQLILALDHCTLGFVEHEQLISTVAANTGEPRENLLVVFSHTHAAGLMGLERQSMPGGDLIPAYLSRIAECASKLVSKALSRLTPVEIVYGTGRCNLAANRDLFDPALNKYVCGYNPAAVADDTVLVARITNADRQTIGTLVNYACHATTLAWENTLISPDYVGALRELVEREMGAPCLFLQGASGDLGPVEGFVGDPTVADRNGRQLAYAALATLASLPEPGTGFFYQGPVVSGATLGSWTHRPLASAQLADRSRWRKWRWHELLPYRLDRPDAGQVGRELSDLEHDEALALAAGDQSRAADCRAIAERKRRLLHRCSKLPSGDKFPCQVVIWRMGDAYWIGVQGELYSVFQTELRRRFPQTPLIVATLASDWGASYLPPRDIYGRGIYQETIAIVAPGSLEQLIEAVAARIQKDTP